jgi:hypothetical protein
MKIILSLYEMLMFYDETLALIKLDDEFSNELEKY